MAAQLVHETGLGEPIQHYSGIMHGEETYGASLGGEAVRKFIAAP